MEVNQFTIDARILDRLFSDVNHCAPCDDGACFTFSNNTSFFEGYDVVAFRDFAVRVVGPGWHIVRVAIERSTVASLCFKEDDGVVSFDGCG